ncbi:hypothetical protein SXCC_02695 [Gluconacetobacter sp. SXCC-1]|nr:hypothetical protein SXCC_02695 [Gluconacetobacter sp. SXCC-1]
MGSPGGGTDGNYGARFSIAVAFLCRSVPQVIFRVAESVLILI